MPKRVTPKGETPDRITINTKPSKAVVDNYYKVLNLSRKTWMEDMSAAARYELYISDITEKIRQLQNEANEIAEENE